MEETQVNQVNDENITLDVAVSRVYKSSSHRRYYNDPSYREIVINRVKDRYKKTKEQNQKKKEIKNKIFELNDIEYILKLLSNQKIPNQKFMNIVKFSLQYSL